MLRDDIQAGRLEQLLPDYDCGAAGMYAVCQDRRYQQAKVRLFIEFIEQGLKQIL
jgi:DNA-binding transcriptional LysR family regulator